MCGESPNTAKKVPLGRENLWREKISFKSENLCEENLTDLLFCLTSTIECLRNLVL